MNRVRHTNVGVPAALVSLESSAAFAFAHVAAGGAVPGPLWLAAFGALVYGGGRLVLRDRAPIRLMLPALLGVQMFGHAWLMTMADAGAHHHAASGGAAAVFALTPTMVLAHAAAGLVTGVMWTLRRRMVDVLLHWADTATLPVPCAPAFRASQVHGGATTGWFVRTNPDRGPPCVRSAFIMAPV